MHAHWRVHRKIPAINVNESLVLVHPMNMVFTPARPQDRQPDIAQILFISKTFRQRMLL